MIKIVILYVYTLNNLAENCKPNRENFQSFQKTDRGLIGIPFARTDRRKSFADHDLRRRGGAVGPKSNHTNNLRQLF